MAGLATTPSPAPVGEAPEDAGQAAHGQPDVRAVGASTGPVVVLIGPPGAGKSTVGHLLARRLGLPFRDTDADVEVRAGRTVADIFVEDGEPTFRALEAEAVRVALIEHPGVLSLGGGAVLDPSTRAALADAPVVLLDVGLAAAVRRTGLGGARPLLAVGTPRATLARMLAERRPIYLSVARAVVSTDERTPDQVADDVLAAVAALATAPSTSEDDES